MTGLSQSYKLFWYVHLNLCSTLQPPTSLSYAITCSIDYTGENYESSDLEWLCLIYCMQVSKYANVIIFLSLIIKSCAWLHGSLKMLCLITRHVPMCVSFLAEFNN